MYDRIGFAAVGKYNEFEVLRVAGVRLADLRGYSYDRVDVTGRGLANAYAQTLGTIFTTEPKPYEVELIVAEVGESEKDDQIYRLTYDGSVADEHGFAAIGGQVDQISAELSKLWRSGMSLKEAVQLAARLLGASGEAAERRKLEEATLEVAVLDRARTATRKFRRIHGSALNSLLVE
jgi:proteasome alpha subunit